MLLYIVLIIIFLFVYYRSADELYNTINMSLHNHNEKMPPLNIYKTLPYHQVSPYGSCGSIGNTCSSDTDCCGGVYCINNTCNQL